MGKTGWMEIVVSGAEQTECVCRTDSQYGHTHMNYITAPIPAQFPACTYTLLYTLISFAASLYWSIHHQAGLFVKKIPVE